MIKTQLPSFGGYETYLGQIGENLFLCQVDGEEESCVQLTRVDPIGLIDVLTNRENKVCQQLRRRWCVANEALAWVRSQAAKLENESPSPGGHYPNSYKAGWRDAMRHVVAMIDAERFVPSEAKG